MLAVDGNGRLLRIGDQVSYMNHIRTVEAVGFRVVLAGSRPLRRGVQYFHQVSISRDPVTGRFETLQRR